MADFLLRDIDERIAERIKEMARQKGWPLNDVMLLLLKQALGIIEPEPAPEPDVPQCSPWQVRKGFNARGMRAAVEQYVAGASQEVKDGYEFATVWKANDPFVIEAGAGLGMTPQQVAEFVAWCATL